MVACNSEACSASVITPNQAEKLLSTAKRYCAIKLFTFVFPLDMRHDTLIKYILKIDDKF